jgi:flagellar basal body rod protein FlgG
MNIGLYQSASALTAIERWQDVVSQNITSSQTTAYRKRTVSFSTELSGELQTDPRGRMGDENGTPAIFPKINTGINFNSGETEPTRRDLDLALQGEGFFEVQMPDESRAYTRSGEFRMRPDRTLVTTGGQEVLNTSGRPIVLLAGGGALTIEEDGTILQGGAQLGKLAVKNFADLSVLSPVAGGYFVAPEGVEAEMVEKPEVLQGYLEGSNTSSLREMVDMVIISRAYEANQKIISVADQTMQKTLDALG